MTDIVDARPDRKSRGHLLNGTLALFLLGWPDQFGTGEMAVRADHIPAVGGGFPLRPAAAPNAGQEIRHRHHYRSPKPSRPAAAPELRGFGTQTALPGQAMGRSPSSSSTSIGSGMD